MDSNPNLGTIEDMVILGAVLSLFGAVLSQADIQIKVNDSQRQVTLRTISEVEIKASKWLMRQGYRQHLSLKKWIEEATLGMTGDENAQIDLLIFEGAGGKKAFVPRHVLQRFDLFLAKPTAMTAVGLDIVVPRKVYPKISSEHLPLDSYMIESVTTIELTNYKTHYGQYLLKKRSDPAAARGEKLFLQTCLGCHSVHNKVETSSLKTKLEQMETFKHKVGEGLPSFDEKESRSLKSYVKALSL
ncbi:MAG: hypothetical protein KA715_05625 [Xanthomonadaceae bacterium]|nr:hypothetical protein [Xanthomonadaceae bacterium]